MIEGDGINTFSSNLLPIPNCWHEQWADFSREYGFDHFPTQDELEQDADKASRFCLWLWLQLGRHQGFLCGSPNTRGCLSFCQSHGVTKLDALCYLSRLVRHVDPTLYFVLNRKFVQIRALNRTPPPGPPQRKPPVAVNMPRPAPWMRTEAVARQHRGQRGDLEF